MLQNGHRFQSAADPLFSSPQGSPSPQPRRILFIDAYDSFSQNIIALLEGLLQVEVDLIHIDNKLYNSSNEQFLRLLSSYDAVVAGPGPGNPYNARDVGLIKKLWDLEGEHLLPVLGICLGFQSLALSCGACVERLREPRHGVVAKVVHDGQSIFRGLVDVQAVQYHSLQVQIGSEKQFGSGLDGAGLPYGIDNVCESLEPLAWDLDNVANGAVLVAMKHASKPFWGVQYHPESICTNTDGAKIMLNWWEEAEIWKSKNRPNKTLKQNTALRRSQGHMVNGNEPFKDLLPPKELDATLGSQSKAISFTSFECNTLTVLDIYDALQQLQYSAVVLESATNASGGPVNSETGQKSVVGVYSSNTLKLHYYIAEKELVIQQASGSTVLRRKVQNIWPFLANLLSSQRVCDGPAESPFWGGFIGYISYEAGLDTIDVTPPSEKCDKRRPDICLAWINESIVVDHVEKTVWVQSIGRNTSEWVDAMSQKLQDMERRKVSAQQNGVNPCSNNMFNYLSKAERHSPTTETYQNKVRMCKEFICAGDSYELCLTDKSKVVIPQTTNNKQLPWQMYLRLRKINPAPFQAYLDFGDLHLLSSSPERFLRWDRKGVCQYRPIKGTVKKRPDLSRAEAVEILSSSKERAENLMIVDLIRHDLHGVVGSGNVTVRKLMSVEEYASVYQLVSVVEGQLGAEQHGIDVLAASLPPGSMTGAPKRRSCEILKGIEEQKPRGIYSGVLGYLDVGGGGDFSVVIRTAYKWNDRFSSFANGDDVGCEEPDDDKDQDVWHIGAGGAVTAQSVDVSEFEEMEAKLDSILRVFNCNVEV